MTKKDYVAIATTIKHSANRSQIIRELANLFEINNPNFDKARFFVACGYGDRRVVRDDSR